MSCAGARQTAGIPEPSDCVEFARTAARIADPHRARALSRTAPGTARGAAPGATAAGGDKHRASPLQNARRTTAWGSAPGRSANARC
eukprot:8182966-Alexandrium_andersonii.AAC.1